MLLLCLKTLVTFYFNFQSPWYLFQIFYNLFKTTFLATSAPFPPTQSCSWALPGSHYLKYFMCFLAHMLFFMLFLLLIAPFLALFTRETPTHILTHPNSRISCFFICLPIGLLCGYLLLHLFLVSFIHSFIHSFNNIHCLCILHQILF